MSASRHAGTPSMRLAPTRPALRRARRWRLAALRCGLKGAEAFVLLAAGVGAALALPPSSGLLPVDWGLLAAGVAALVTLEASGTAGLAPPRPPALAGPLALAGAAGSGTLALLGVPWRTSLAWAAGDVATAGLLLACVRAAYAEILQLMLDDGWLTTPVAVVGAGPVAWRTLARLRDGDPRLVTVLGRYAESPEPGAAERARGNLRTLLCDCRLGAVDAVVLAVEPDDEDGLRRLREILRPCIQDVYLSPELLAHADATARVFALGATPLLLVSERPIKGWPAVAKRACDQIGAWLLLLFMSPLLLLIALAIRIESPGPILFRQLRVGYNNQLFHIFKFRSMYHDATDRLARQQTVYGDKRVTRVGRLIRRLSLDELPQLLNVVRGEMSLVGPRPHAPGTSVGGQRVHHLVENYACRHLVRPGITGLAQVRGLRGGLHDRRQLADRLAADLEYIQTWSLWLDLKVLVLTTVLELRGSHAC